VCALLRDGITGRPAGTISLEAVLFANAFEEATAERDGTERMQKAVTIGPLVHNEVADTE